MTEETSLLTAFCSSSLPEEGTAEGNSQQEMTTGMKATRTERNLWRHDEIFALLHTMQDTYALDRLNDKSMKSDIVFKDIEEAMFEKGFRKKSAIQIATKWKLLKSTYTTSRRDGIIPRMITPDIYSELHKMLKHCHNKRMRRKANTNLVYMDHHEESSNFLPLNSATSSRNSADQSNGDGSVHSMIISRIDGGICELGIRTEELTVGRGPLEPPDDLNVAHPIFGYRLGSVKAEPYEEIDSDNEERNNKVTAMGTQRRNTSKNFSGHFTKAETMNGSTGMTLDRKMQPEVTSRVADTKQQDKNVVMSRVAQWLPNCTSDEQRYTRHRVAPQVRVATFARSPSKSPSRRSSPLHSGNKCNTSLQRRRMSSPIGNAKSSRFTITTNSNDDGGERNLRFSAEKRINNNLQKDTEEDDGRQNSNCVDESKEKTVNNDNDDIVPERTENPTQDLRRNSSVCNDSIENNTKIMENGINHHARPYKDRALPSETHRTTNKRTCETMPRNRRRLVFGDMTREFAITLRSINRNILRDFVNAQKEIMQQERKMQMEQMQLMMESFQKQTLRVLRSIGTMSMQHRQHQQIQQERRECRNYSEMRKSYACCCHGRRMMHGDYRDSRLERYHDTTHHGRMQPKDLRHKYNRRYDTLPLPKWNGGTRSDERHNHLYSESDDEQQSRHVAISDSSDGKDDFLPQANYISSSSVNKYQRKRKVHSPRHTEKSKNNEDKQHLRYVHTKDCRSSSSDEQAMDTDQ